MKTIEGLDFSGLAQFRASDLLVSAEPPSKRGKPMQVSLELIDFDPAQPRRSIDKASIAELAVSFTMHGVLEPVSLRTHPYLAGRFIVNRGERRVRAARKAGLAEVPAFLDERVDPYAQAVENLHRENMTPFDLATFIAEREKEGHSRAEIARRLNKPRSFVTEAACLIGAPAEVRRAYEAGRLGSGTRLLYRLAVAMEKQPAVVTALLAGDAMITRASVEPLLAANTPTGHGREPAPDAPTAKASAVPSAGRTVLVVEHAGRRGSLRLKAHDNDIAEVRFGDGTRDLVELKELRLVCWATEE